MSIDLKNHFCLQTSSSTTAVCSELFKFIDINHFTYTNINLQTQKRFFLTTHPQWIHYFYKHSLYKNKIIVQAEYFKNFSHFLWQDFAHEKPFVDCKKFNLRSGITIVNPGSMDTNIYWFAADDKNNNQFYLTALKLFNHFILYFHNTAGTLINLAKKHAFLCLNSQNLLATDTEASKEEFFSNMQVKRIYLDNNGTYLTKQEALCTYLLMFGESAKTAARILNISNRTVESYLMFVKEKLNCTNIRQIYAKISKSILYNQFLMFTKECLKNLN